MAYEALYTRGRPKTFAHLIGQEHISNALTRAVCSDRLSHAYLLVGTRGTGKTSTARLLAKAMNCDTIHQAVQSGKTLTPREIPCNKCASCLSIDSSPDNVEFDAASNRSVEDVTRLLSTAYLAPLQSRVKTFIIDEVHMLSFEAVNSILKLIEEPPPNVAFFLATTELQKVPMTIRSRCQVLNFRLIPAEKISQRLLQFAKRLEVELQVEAANKIARLAEGSMRDALTYLDQCYSMSDKVITLDDVNQTLGLISDADLDEIISALKTKDREKLSAAISHAFSSGLSSLTIAESLITRLRDLIFANLKNSAEIHQLENFVETLRGATLEMQGSGIPDIILEMTLMQSAAPAVKIISTTEISQPVQKVGNVEEGKKIFEAALSNVKDLPLKAQLSKSSVKDFDGETLTLAFRSEMLQELFNKEQSTFEAALLAATGRQIKSASVIDKNLSNADFFDLDKGDKDFLKNAMNIFQTDNIQKMKSEE